MRGGRWSGLVGVALALTLVLAACGDDDSGGGTTNEGASFAEGTTMARLNQAGTVTVGTKFDQPLFGLKNLEATPKASTSRSPSSSPASSASPPTRSTSSRPCRPTGNRSSNFRSFINDTLDKLYQDGRWKAAWDATAGKVATETPTPPAVNRYQHQAGAAARGVASMAGILLVHGAWHGPWCWARLAERLAGHGRQVQAVQLRGHDRPPGRIRHRVHHYVQDVGATAARFVEPPVLVGHSLGGLIVQKYLEHGPAQAAILLAPLPHRGTLPAIARLTLRHPTAMLAATLSLRLRPFVATPALVRELFFTPDSPQALVDDTLARLQDESWPP
jgi:hypothetical protein